MAKKKMNFEDAFNRLEEIVENMEENNTSLDETLKLYKEGVDLSVFLDNEIKTAKKEVLILKQQTNGIFEEVSFEEGEYNYE